MWYLKPPTELLSIKYFGIFEQISEHNPDMVVYAILSTIENNAVQNNYHTHAYHLDLVKT